MSRKEAHSNSKLIHRVVHAFAYTKDGRVWLEKRSMKKDRYPGEWEATCAGHLNVGESYDNAVRREIKEEAGINSKKIFFIGKWKYRGRDQSENIAVYAFETSKTPEENEEIEEFKLFALKEARNKSRKATIPSLTKSFEMFEKWFNERQR